MPRGIPWGGRKAKVKKTKVANKKVTEEVVGLKENALERRYEMANRLEQALGKLEDAREARDMERSRRAITDDKFVKSVGVLRAIVTWAQNFPTPLDAEISNHIRDAKALLQGVGPAVSAQ